MLIAGTDRSVRRPHASPQLLLDGVVEIEEVQLELTAEQLQAIALMGRQVPRTPRPGPGPGPRLDLSRCTSQVVHEDHFRRYRHLRPADHVSQHATEPCFQWPAWAGAGGAGSSRW